MEKYLSPKLDVVFKMIFGSSRDVEVLGDFLLTVLDIEPEEVQEIDILDPFVELDTPEEKKSILDVKVGLKSGRRVNVEIQLKKLPNLIPRIHYYKAKMVTEQIGVRDPYTRLAPTSCIIILDKPIYSDPYCHHQFRYYDVKRKVEFSDYEEIHILEIPKLEQDKSNPQLADWLRFLNMKQKEDFDMLAEKSEPMKKAVGILARLSADEKARMIAEAREKELWDQMDREQGAREEGRQEGREEGKKEEKLEIARGLLGMNMPIADIAKVTGLALSEIELLK